MKRVSFQFLVFTFSEDGLSPREERGEERGDREKERERERGRKGGGGGGEELVGGRMEGL